MKKRRKKKGHDAKNNNIMTQSKWPEYCTRREPVKSRLAKVKKRKRKKVSQLVATDSVTLFQFDVSLRGRRPLVPATDQQWDATLFGTNRYKRKSVCQLKITATRHFETKSLISAQFLFDLLCLLDKTCWGLLRT